MSELQVGDGVTIHIGSDRYAGTVTHVTRCCVDVKYDGGDNVKRFRRSFQGAKYRNGHYYLSEGRDPYLDPSF